MNPIRLHHIQRAWDIKDPDLPELVIACAVQPDPKPEKALRKGAPDFQAFLREIRSPVFRKKSKEGQARFRKEQMRMLEAPDAEVPLPDRRKLHEILMEL